ncbi:MAG TPA: hypothetical protein VNG93_13325 [Candidatus Dormibacteraeota bacterium]|nr:hypothetical protein [Candidatus Dormibacteraeota bacterium]
MAGVPLLLMGLFVRGAAFPAAVPIFDVAAISCLLLTATVTGVDAALSGQRDSLPTMAIGLAGAVLWAVHLTLFPGDFQLNFAGASSATPSVFLAINLALPIMLALAPLQRRGPLRRWLGGANLVPSVVALAIFLASRRGEERVSGWR